MEKRKVKAKDIRAVDASGKMATLVDEGHKLDKQLTKMKEDEKKHRKQVAEEGGKLKKRNELSVRVRGKQSEAVISDTESFELNTTKAAFETVKDAVRRGQLEGVVNARIAAVIAPESIERVRKVLGKSFDEVVTIVTNFSVNPEGFREFRKEARKDESKKEMVAAIDSCVEKKVTTKVRYNAIKKKV